MVTNPPPSNDSLAAAHESVLNAIMCLEQIADEVQSLPRFGLSEQAQERLLAFRAAFAAGQPLMSVAGLPFAQAWTVSKLPAVPPPASSVHEAAWRIVTEQFSAMAACAAMSVDTAASVHDLELFRIPDEDPHFVSYRLREWMVDVSQLITLGRFHADLADEFAASSLPRWLELRDKSRQMLTGLADAGPDAILSLKQLAALVGQSPHPYSDEHACLDQLRGKFKGRPPIRSLVEKLPARGFKLVKLPPDAPAELRALRPDLNSI